MFHFKKRNSKKETYDSETQYPMILVSICTGEQTAGFRNKETGKFSPVQLVTSQEDLQEFLDRYGILEEIPREY